MPNLDEKIIGLVAGMIITIILVYIWIVFSGAIQDVAPEDNDTQQQLQNIEEKGIDALLLAGGGTIAAIILIVFALTRRR